MIGLIAVDGRRFAVIIICRIIRVACGHDVFLFHAQIQQLLGRGLNNRIHALLCVRDAPARNRRIRRHRHHVRRRRHDHRALGGNLRTVSVGKRQRRDGQHQRQRKNQNLFHISFSS